ncbi:MAG: DUF1538 domain-containing protein [Synergistaceae bacterium]|nr:DUF1538 domain-containing protein [Synergistaceae bacterium]
MREKLKEMTLESLSSVLPLTLIVSGITVLIAPVPVGKMVLFWVGAALLIIGMGILNMGVDMALMPFGNDIGASITKTRKIGLICAASFAIGVTIAFAGPDVQVLAMFLPGMGRWTLPIAISVGAGFALLLAVLRIILHIPMSKILMACYAVLIALMMFAPAGIAPVAFDSGGVVTGPISVPFILAMGLGIASVRSDRGSLDDSFGLVALCVIGSPIAVLILGMLFSPGGHAYTPPTVPAVETTRDVALEFVKEFPHYLAEVAKTVWPVIAVFIIYQGLTRSYHVKQFTRLLIGFGYTYIGLVIFMTGVEVGFIPVGTYLGADLAASEVKWLLIPLGALIGYFVVAAEPAVHALCKQIEEVSLGVIPGSAVMRYMSWGVAAALSLTMTRIMFEIPIYWILLPCYLLALVLMYHVPKIYTGIAFDAAGAVTGPMASTFILPFALGACVNSERIMLDAFGTVGLIAMTPPVSLQIMGFIYEHKKKPAVPGQIHDILDDEIVVFDEAGGKNKDE